jgi:NAD(P)H-dependent flavin oxidoreductase YrpB (nitropropane dioxygenase family)
MVSALGTPQWLIDECHAVGTKVMSMVGAIRHAKRLEDMGVDIIVAQGMEAGGHVGTVTTMVLVPGVVDNVSIPVLAAGGIIDGRGIAAGMMLGAQGAWIGTRFIATEEATAPKSHKQGILKADENGTVVSRCYTGKPSRVLKNEFTTRWHGRDRELLPMPWQRIRVEKLVAPAKAAGMPEIANFPTGQAAGAINDVPKAADIFQQMVRETEGAFAR